MNKKQWWTTKEDAILIANYGKILSSKISKLLPKRTTRGIHSRAAKLGLKGNTGLQSKIYDCDQNFFDIPNLINNYFAGYIAADGCILDNYDVQLVCKTSDRILLENFKKATKATNIIKDKIVKNKDNDKIYFKSILNFNGQIQWCNKLLKYWNITPRKSFTLQPPNVTDQFQKYAFIIGLFDGDGGIFFPKKRKKRSLGLDFCGTEILMNWVRDQIKILCPNLSWNCKVKKCSVGKLYHIRWTGKKAIIIHQSLKNIVSISYRLERKWDIDYHDFTKYPQYKKNYN